MFSFLGRLLFSLHENLNQLSTVVIFLNYLHHNKKYQLELGQNALVILAHFTSKAFALDVVLSSCQSFTLDLVIMSEFESPPKIKDKMLPTKNVIVSDRHMN